MPFRTLRLVGLAAIFAGVLAAAQHVTRNLFPHATDIGSARHGATAFDPATATYTITGGGADMWGTSDAFRFAWQRIEGDATLTATIQFPPGQHPPNEKAVLMFRQSLDPASRYADVAVHADGHITLQWRDVYSGQTDDVTAGLATPAHGRTAVLRIQRVGALFTASAASPGSPLTQFGSAVIALRDPVYVGVGICAHDANGLATVTFSNVNLRHGGWSALPSPR
ncbi:MAG TPA: hypothetical protein VKT75_03500 [Acidobacteriaceae bacterium]|nr:hypothetical protein [Acidobacteriaceae bacterium]